MAYCEVGDIDLGTFTVPRFMTVASQIESASDEIDAAIGQVYQLPLNIPVGSPDAFLLKKVNSFLTKGRIILAAANGGEDSRLHNHGIYLVREAEKVISGIVSGAIKLESGTLLPTETVKFGEFILNKDEDSFVEGFYGSAGTSAGPNTGYLPGVSQDGPLW